MKRLKKITSLFLTLALSIGLTSSLTACKPAEEVTKSSFNITMPDSNNLSVKLMSSEVTVTNEGYLTKTLTATVSPATQYNQAVNWSVEWKNANSTWATGKSVNDYVEVLANAQNSLKATVTCKQAFGEQVNVIVSSQMDNTKSATCVCDYKRRLLNFDLTKMGISEIREVNGEKRVISKLGYSEVNDTNITYNVNYSDCTVTTEDSEFSLYIRLTDEFIDLLGDKYISKDPITVPGGVTFGDDINMLSITDTGDLVLNAVTVTDKSFIRTYYRFIENGGTPESYLIPTSYLNKLSSFGSEKAIGHIVVVRSWYNLGTTHYETYCQYPIYLDESVVNLAVSNVALASNNIVF